MLQQDYLLRIILQFVEALRHSWAERSEKRDPQGAAAMLEAAISDAVDIDSEALLSLAPESFVSVVQVSGADPHVMEYVARSLVLTSLYLQDAGKDMLSGLRLEQAQALAEAFDIDLPLHAEDTEQILSCEQFRLETERNLADIQDPRSGGDASAENL